MILYDWLGVVAVITFVVCSGLLYEILRSRYERGLPSTDISK